MRALADFYLMGMKLAIIEQFQYRVANYFTDRNDRRAGDHRSSGRQ
jgi:hypothetical protein